MAQTAKIIPLSTPLTPTWPIAGDVPDLRAIITDQSKTIAAQAALIDAYQATLSAAQAAAAPLPTAYGTGTASGSPATTLTVANLQGGNIIIGAIVAGPGIPTGTAILGQTTGTPGLNGVYTTSNPTTANSAPLTFTPPPPTATWPTPTDAPTLLAIQQDQTSVIRTQTALIQQYLDLLNASLTPPPPTGP